MIGNGNEPPGLCMEEMYVTAGLPYRRETKSGESPDYFTS